MLQSSTRRQPDEINSGSSLSARLANIGALTDRDRLAMFELYHQYYESTSPDLFLSDLLAKDQAIMLYDDAGVLRGFSTLKLMSFMLEQQAHRVIFSGDTIVHHHYWGEQSLAFSWIRRAGEIKAEQPDMPLYYLLIVKGHRTYRYLQAFTRNYYPHWQHSTPRPVQAFMDRLGESLFSGHYRKDRGVVKFPVSRGQLRPEWAKPTGMHLARPEVQFFLQKNPGYRRGDELLCLAELCSNNLRPLARRLFEAGTKR